MNFKDEIILDSLWILKRRDNSGAHSGWYWGNFIPEIPRQMMLRFTQPDDWVLDGFAGSGTTLIEAKRLGRNCIGIELNSEIVKKAKEQIELEPNDYGVSCVLLEGDSRTIKLQSVPKVQLLILHPPYHDIIKFSNDSRDLSNAKSVEEFLKMFGKVVDNLGQYLVPKGHLVLVIGDKYSKGEWIPLGFYCMQEVLRRKEYKLKSIIVKNFEETRGKKGQRALWKYRALKGGFYLFKHEYIFLFQKR